MMWCFALTVLAICLTQATAYLPSRHRCSLVSQIARRSVAEPIERCTFQGPGHILLAKSGEYDHVFRKSAILVCQQSKEGTQGLVLNKRSAFPIGEMAPGMGVFASNALYMGGNDGGDTAIMIHTHHLDGNAKHIGNGIYLGGMKQAREMVEGFKAHPRDFRFVFNNVHWSPGVLEKEIESGRWVVCRVPPALVVHEDDLWEHCLRAGVLT